MTFHIEHLTAAMEIMADMMDAHPNQQDGFGARLRAEGFCPHCVIIWASVLSDQCDSSEDPKMAHMEGLLAGLGVGAFLRGSPGTSSMADKGWG